MIDKVNELSEINNRLVKQNDKLKKELKQLNQWHVIADGDFPKESSFYIVTYKNGTVGIFDKCGVNELNEEVIAWLELPQPYKERD